MVTSDLRAEVEIWPFRACVMHPAIIIEQFVTNCSVIMAGCITHARNGHLWTWLWDRHHVPQNVFLV